MHRARRVFELAARPGKRYRTFPNEINDSVLFNGVEEPIYDSLNVREFSGTLTELEESWLRHVERILGFYILMPDVPDMTTNQHRLYCQIRAANIGMAMTLDEADHQRKIAGNTGPAMIRRFNTILTPIRILQLQDDPDCPIFQEPLGKAHVIGEEAVKLPCSHIVGHQCIETWVAGWEPGYPFSVCPLCRAHFVLLTPWETAAGVGTPNEDPEPPAGWWLHLLRAA
jgi:hypothetical protein